MGVETVHGHEFSIFLHFRLGLTLNWIMLNNRIKPCKYLFILTNELILTKEGLTHRDDIIHVYIYLIGWVAVQYH